MPTIMFPDVPLFPGVPQLLRPISAAIASNPVLSIGLGTTETLLITALNQAPTWGIFDQNGNQLGLLPNSQSTLQAIAGTLVSQLTGNNAPVLSTFALDFTQETRVSDFPVENGSFATYNKYVGPATPVVTLILDGSQADRTAFLNLINAACVGTDLYSVVTPEVTYYNYTIERYSYTRRASKGVTLLYVECHLKQVMQVQATLTTASPIPAPVNPAAAASVDNGNVAPAAATQSLLKQLANSVNTSLGNLAASEGAN
jgi:hypothetical protein